METSVYYYLDWYTKQRRAARCEIISRTEKTALIRLMEFGPKNAPPNTKIRVRLSSLVLPKEPLQDLGWHEYTDL